MITRVLDQTIHAGSHVETTVRVRAPTQSVAEDRAANRAILHLGYTPAMLLRSGVEYSVQSTEKSEMEVGNVWLAEVRIEGLI